MKRNAAGIFIVSLLTLLFGYTAMMKILNHESFRHALEQMPLLKTGAAVIAWAVPLTELMIVLLLLFPGTGVKGIWASLLLLTVFTCYLGYMVLSDSKLPCSCGGIISTLSWNEHIVVNLLFIGLSALGVWLHMPGKINTDTST